MLILQCIVYGLHPFAYERLMFYGIIKDKRCMKKLVMMHCASLNINILNSYIMNKKKMMYAGFINSPTLSLCVFKQRNGGSWCSAMAYLSL